MKYFQLNHSIKQKEVGKFPQVETFEVYGNIRGYIEPGEITGNKELPEPNLVSKAKLTTFLSGVINPNNFLVFKKYFIDFLKDYDFGEYQSWILNVRKNGELIRDYSLFYLMNDSQDKYVDFEGSEFLVGKLGDWKDTSSRKPVKVKNYREYLNLIDVLKNSNDKSDIRCDKLVLNLSSANEDLFRLSRMPYFGDGYYVSERLKNDIDNQGFTGISFKEIHEVDRRMLIIN